MNGRLLWRCAEPTNRATSSLWAFLGWQTGCRRGRPSELQPACSGRVPTEAPRIWPLELAPADPPSGDPRDRPLWRRLSHRSLNQHCPRETVSGAPFGSHVQEALAAFCASLASVLPTVACCSHSLSSKVCTCRAHTKKPSGSKFDAPSAIVRRISLSPAVGGTCVHLACESAAAHLRNTSSGPANEWQAANGIDRHIE